MEKSYVTMAQYQCPICFTVFDANELLLNTKLENVFDKYTVTGYSLCPNCEKLEEEGYIALVGLKPKDTWDAEVISLEESLDIRSGEYLHMKREVFAQIINPEVPNLPMVFVHQDIIDQIKERLNDSQ